MTKTQFIVNGIQYRTRKATYYTLVGKRVHSKDYPPSLGPSLSYQAVNLWYHID